MYTHKHILFLFLLLATLIARPQSPRTDILLNNHWRTIATDSNLHTLNNFETPSFNDKSWKLVDVPHNWDDYDGYRRLRHGNRHGTAWYRRTFIINNDLHPEPDNYRHPERSRRVEGRHFFLFFEGVGSYATVWVNGHKAGYHAGGRTTFTIDITELVNRDGSPNQLTVQADHPAFIKDLPWVCGGCSDERGFSEGSQPMGIFRPVHLISTNDIRIEPFGVHVWNGSIVSLSKTKPATIFLETELKNYSNYKRTVQIESRLLDKNRQMVSSILSVAILSPWDTMTLRQQEGVYMPHLWSPAHPYLYAICTILRENGRVIDSVTTPYGIRTIRWPSADKKGPFLINGKPFFINGVAEYEHLIGSSHAFTNEQVHARVSMIKAAGFNAFRDAHQPHNLRYQQYWDKEGLLWWPQLSAHIWYDTPEFKENFLRLLRDWVKERRNSPSLVLWGLQNESKLPKAFAGQCAAIIREMDPTASSQRKITSCNGGEGTDWDVPQNWTGTYGGDPATYGSDLIKQVLVGEYGGWRTLDLHQNQTQSTLRSEDQLTQLMETKIRLANTVKDSVAGHFFWLLSSHDNPGRVQGGEGWREIDRVGPVNYKGLFTPWEEPLDVFYMYRANFVSNKKDPMVYIVSHTNPDRWIAPVDKDSIIIYSNCEEVELYNDIDSISFGKQRKQGIGTHFQWNDVPVRYNILYAKGYVNGRVVARDTVLLHHLPLAPHLKPLYLRPKHRVSLRPDIEMVPVNLDTTAIIYPQKGYHYIYRVNCGGDAYTDDNGNKWLGDRARRGDSTWGSESWTNRFPGSPPLFASQRRTQDIIQGTRDWPLFQSFRYGREELKYIFPLPDGDYRVELYFIEPWINWAGGVGERLFDVAINNTTVLHNLDIYKEAGHNRALKKTVTAHITGGSLVVSFPRVASGQALISAIAIASLHDTKAAPSPQPLVQVPGGPQFIVHDWMDTGDFSELPPALYGAQWLEAQEDVFRSVSHRSLFFDALADAMVYIGLDTLLQQTQPGMEGFTDTKTFIRALRYTGYHVFRVWSKRLAAGTEVYPTDFSMADDKVIIAATPVSTIEPAYDLKPITNYKAVNAWASPGLNKETANGKPVLMFKHDTGDTLQWIITTGVADMYSLAIRYQGPATQCRLQLIDQNDHILNEQIISFPPSAPGKWNYANASTGVVINAGEYRLRLIGINAMGFAVEGLDVQ